MERNDYWRVDLFEARPPPASTSYDPSMATATRSPLRHWVLWILIGACIVAVTACGVLMVVALLIWQQWILAALMAAVVVAWIHQVATNDTVQAVVRYVAATVRRKG